ncbi:MAG: endonuclease G [Lentimonas sp.]|jgi:endonuclease G
MAVKKRATRNNTTTRKRTLSKAQPERKPARKSFLRTAFVVLLLAICAVTAAYYFGPFGLRTQLEHSAIKSVNGARTPEWMPRPIVSLLNMGYDAIPGSQGLAVEGGELGHEESPLIAGVPQSKSPVRVLHNKSYINLFNEKERQATCIAFKLSDSDRKDAPVPDGFFEDPRIKQLRARDMRLGQWMPSAMAPAVALAGEFGEVGANEAHLVTNLTPMSADFSDGLWQRLMQEITVNYPKRFGEVWIYLGPVMRKESSKLQSGRLIPDGFYAIVFDLTDAGGLRAIAFLVPQDAEGTALHNYITSIDTVETHTGLEFLPEIDYHAREVLGASMSPQLW